MWISGSTETRRPVDSNTKIELKEFHFLNEICDVYIDFSPAFFSWGARICALVFIFIYFYFINNFTFMDFFITFNLIFLINQKKSQISFEMFTNPPHKNLMLKKSSKRLKSVWSWKARKKQIFGFHFWRNPTKSRWLSPNYWLHGSSELFTGSEVMWTEEIPLQNCNCA